ncbi:MAG TPA: branched-chain amino acid ABC transporter permease [Acidimicrobiia bacterium]|nr:branched-chain amino acid ABC transporter permease [Acidimicrobiia bacterium]
MPRGVAIVAGFVLLGSLVSLGVTSDSQRVLTLAIQTMMLAALASSWNILGGFAGQISLGHAVFFGLGSLITRELWLSGTALPLAVAAALAVTAAAAALVGVPMLRFRDIYFAIGTLALGVAVFITVGNLRPRISSLSAETLRNYDFTGPYFMTLGVLVVTVVVSLWLKRSKLGLGMMAVREDEEAAGATGVNAFFHKMIAFILSAVLAALAGATFAYFSVSYFPNFAFSVIWTFEAILVVFIGGVGTIVGPVIGSVFFIIGRDALPTDIDEFQVVLFGLLFIVVVLLMPGGLTEAAQRFLAKVSKRRSPPTKEPTATKGKELV